MPSARHGIANAWLILGTLGLPLNGCVASDAPRWAIDSVAAEVLWLPAGARLETDAARPALVRHGRSIYMDGSGAVVFSVVASCDDIAAAIGDHFAQAGWRARQMQDLNPQLRTSVGSGCEPRKAGIIQLGSNGRLIPRGPYMDWWGEWQNEAGDLVAYRVGGTDRELRGYGEYLPRQVRDAKRRSLGR